MQRIGDPKYGATWFIHFDEFYAELPEPNFVVGDLLGGKEDTPPEINATMLKPYRNNIVLDFVDHDMLF